MNDAKTREQQEFFANRLKKRFKHLWKYAKRVETTALSRLPPGHT